MNAAPLPHLDHPPASAGEQVASALAHVDRLTAAAKTPPILAALPAAEHPIQTIGICGAGVMGTGIALANLQRRVRVRIYDASPEAMQRAQATLHAESIQADLPRPLDDWLQICPTHSSLGPCDLVIETVAENRELKQRVFQQLAPYLGAHALLATNTSTIRLAELATAVPDPGRFGGLHFCNPTAVRPLVEIVRAAGTSDATLAALAAYVIGIGKLPILVHDSPGFLVNRLLLPYLNEALEMLCQGTELRAIDEVGRRFGMEYGPFEMLDMIGVDTAMRAGRTLWEAYPDRITLTPVLPRLVKLGRLGQKTGRGFYSYGAPGDPGQSDPELGSILAPYIRAQTPLRHGEIAARLILPMLLEATRALEEQVVDHPRDVDLGLLFGLAFPRARGGLLYWADQLGPATILQLLAPLEVLGSRMRPTPLLQELAAQGGRFYS